MDEGVVSDSSLLVIPSVCARKTDDWYPVYFGVSCAFFALRLLSGHGLSEDNGHWSEVCDKVLRGSAQLLGVLVWKSQKMGFDEEKQVIRRKLESAEREVEELKRIRREDAKANEKVVGIFAAQEQRWFNERKKLQQHVGSLINDIRILAKKRDEVISDLNGKIEDMETVVQSKDKLLEEERVKFRDLEEKLRQAEAAVEHLLEKAKREAEEHSSKIWKHKTTFIELVSNQRRIEAELERALRQVEVTKREFESAFVQKEESTLMAQKLSMEVEKMQNDVEQKDKILSAMLRKSRLDTKEKQMLMKEVRLSKSKKKQAELEAERFKSVSETKDAGNSLRSMFANQVSLKLQGLSGVRKVHAGTSGSSHVKKSRSQTNDLLEYDNHDSAKETDGYSTLYYSYSPEEYSAQGAEDDKRLENWVQLEAAKYAKVMEQRHHLEVDAFMEQMRLKDEKLEAFRWRMLGIEIESKRLHSHIEGLNREISQLRLKNAKLEALLLNREEELDSLKERFFSHSNQLTMYQPEVEENDAIMVSEIRQEGDVEILESPSTSQPSEIMAVQSPERESEEDKEVDSHSFTIIEAIESPANIGKVEKSMSPSQQNPPWKMDLQALGLFYKIKRLKQQLLMIERLIGKQESSHDADGKNEQTPGIKNFLSLIAVLNKQVGRYQSLQEKIDDLCKRLHDKDLKKTLGKSEVSRTKKRTKDLEIFLEETFQLQRYMVATGQKLMEIQSKVANGFVGVAEQIEKSINIDMKRFSDGLRSLFQDVQGGLEVRIARIIGDLEGTLACDGMIHLSR